MKRINQFKAFVVVAIVVIIISVIAITMRLDSSNPVARAMNNTIAPVQNFFVDIAHDVRNFGQSTIDVFRAHEENQRLREQMFQVEGVNIENDLLREQNQALQDMLNIAVLLEDFHKISAVTVGRDLDSWHDFILVNVGANDGVETGMAVVSREGYLIGRVTEVMSGAARIHLIKPHNTDIRAHVEVHGLANSQGMFHGYDIETEELIVTNVRHDVEVEVGARVITSGLGGVFPRGLLAGYVTRLEMNTDGLTQQLFLSNQVNYQDLRFVFIISRDLVVDDSPVIPQTTEPPATTEVETDD